MMLIILILSVLFLAWSNGANDNFKGVATLYGSGTTTYRQALVWATAATVVGSLVSVVFASALVKAFSGSGLVPKAMIDPVFLGSIGLAAAMTIFLATRLGMPTSTTHALTGALVGAGMTAAGAAGIGWDLLLVKFAQPLLLSPVLAIGVTVVMYPLVRHFGTALGIRRESSCLCVGSKPGVMVPGPTGAAAFSGSTLELHAGHTAACFERYSGRFIGIRMQTVVDAMHYLSGGAVCFARAVNDTPKIAALLLAGTALGVSHSRPMILSAVALAMAFGGWVHSRRVAETMSRKITELSPGQGLTANLTTAAVVFGASQMGLPVSTTHVSTGSIFGMGLVRGTSRWRTVFQILLAWLTTLPLSAALGAGIYLLLSRFFAS